MSRSEITGDTDILNWPAFVCENDLNRADIIRLGVFNNLSDTVYNEMSDLSLLLSSLRTLYFVYDSIRSDRDRKALNPDKAAMYIQSNVLSREKLKKLLAALPKLTDGGKSSEIIDMIQLSVNSDHPSYYNLNMLSQQPAIINSPPLDSFAARKDWYEYILLKLDFARFPYNAGQLKEGKFSSKLVHSKYSLI